MAKAAKQLPRPAAPHINPDKLPREYAMIVEGDCMAPKLPHGSRALFSSVAKYKNGDMVAIFLKPEFVTPGKPNVIVKQLLMGPPFPDMKFPFADHPKSDVTAIIMLEMINPRQQFVYLCSAILGIHKCLGALPEERATRSATPKEIASAFAGPMEAATTPAADLATAHSLVFDMESDLTKVRDLSQLLTMIDPAAGGRECIDAVRAAAGMILQAADELEEQRARVAELLGAQPVH